MVRVLAYETEGPGFNSRPCLKLLKCKIELYPKQQQQLSSLVGLALQENTMINLINVNNV